MEAYQASCVAIGGRGLLIEGLPGSGKSSLALALIDRGAELVGDDSLLIEGQHGALLARPHPNTTGLLEVRNLGLLSYPVREMIRVAIVIRLDENSPRFIDRPDQMSLQGIGLPMVCLWPGGPILHLKAELALRRFGLEF